MKIAAINIIFISFFDSNVMPSQQNHPQKKRNHPEIQTIRFRIPLTGEEHTKPAIRHKNRRNQ